MENRIEVKKIHTVVVGSGAAGLNGAHRLRQYGVKNVALVTEDMKAGTSRNTGSDKQTYYKLSLAGEQGDSVRRLAQVLYDGGCVDGDHALCEASLSCQGFFKLVDLGVPFPHDTYGEFVGYKTDHDPNDRGSSAGPYTSRYMTEALEAAVKREEILIYDHFQVVQILTHKEKLYGILCLDTAEGRYVMIGCTNLVWATGGPAGIYGNSVYPASQFGASGLAFEAGVLGKNLTEWQYGLASLKPRWNVSGSYMQALPRVVSTNQEGQEEREFLTEFFQSLEKMMDMVFLKGYQWPFDARKAAGGSSVIDLLVYREICVRRRRVWLDYRSNPGGTEVDFSALSSETREYLEQSDACKETPFERLRQLNEPAVNFYQEHGVDLKTQRLEVAVCAQHNNGGLSVDSWWQTNIEGLFAVGEVAGTHGVYRPGGSALNAGQAGSSRAAEYIAVKGMGERRWTQKEEEFFLDQARKRIAMGEAAVNWEGERKGKEGKSFSHYWQVATQKMSKAGAMVRDRKEIKQILTEIEAELEKIEGIEKVVKDAAATGEERNQTGRVKILSRFFRYYDMRICQKMYLEAMLDYIDHGGKSRGSAVYKEDLKEKKDSSDEQIAIPELVAFSLEGQGENGLWNMVQEMSWEGSQKPCASFWRRVRSLENISENQAFEVVWKAFREKRIYMSDTNCNIRKNNK